jgi:DNA-binding response OmpR family regulator
MVRLGDNGPVKALVISPDEDVRNHLRVALQSAERRTEGTWQYFEASDGLAGLRVAWRELPDVVVADEIASRAGGFAVAKDLRGAAEPFPGAIVIVLARHEDAWLARWSGADAWIERPIDPFALADVVVEAVERRHPQEVR